MFGGAHIEIIDPRAKDDRGPLVPQRVLINGVDVGFVATDGVDIEVGGGNGVAQVTLRLYPGRLTIRGADPEAEGQ